MEDNVIHGSISFELDDDGFLSQECPECMRIFKVVFEQDGGSGDGSRELSFCPYCGHQGHGCWWTQEQAAYIPEAVSAKTIGPMLDDMARSFNRGRRRGGFLDITLDVKRNRAPTPPKESNEFMPQARFKCCDEGIKHDGKSAALHCILCGTTQSGGDERQMGA